MIIYHKKRKQTKIGDYNIFHDDFIGNQDPYIWNKNFLHTYCHITQIKAEIGDLIFWVYGDSYPYFSKLYCDCVFKVEEKIYWNSPNFIDINDTIVENKQTYEHHYKWAGVQHYLQKRRRYTLKAINEKSFQPQNKSKELIDILPYLNLLEITTENLINSICLNRNGSRSLNSRPFMLSNTQANSLYNFIYKESEIKLTGEILEKIHPFK